MNANALAAPDTAQHSTTKSRTDFVGLARRRSPPHSPLTPSPLPKTKTKNPNPCSNASMNPPQGLA